jgi:L-erythro-3,5-diaminohexanoate dehydrogenase
MMVGNGYAKCHADPALNIMRESSDIRKLYEKIYC